MKVLMISGDEQVLNTSSAVARRLIEYGKTFGGLDVLILVSGGGKDFVLSSETKVFVCGGKFSRFFKGFLYGWGLMKKNKYDAISAQDTERSFLAWLLSYVFNVPWQMQIHTDILSPHFSKHSFFDWMRVKLVKFLIPRADGMRVVSQRIKDSILRTIDCGLSTKITVLPIFLDVAKVRNTPIKINLHEKYGQDKFIILMPTRLTREKNIEMVLKAIALIPAFAKATACKRAMLLIVGEGPEKENLKRMAYDLGFTTENVVFENAADFETLISYYKTADVYLLTSVYEGGARAPLEALAAGLPVIMTDVAPANEDIIDGVNGRVIPVGNSKVLSKCILELISDKEKLMKLKTGAQNSLQNPISKEEYLASYKKLLSFGK